MLSRDIIDRGHRRSEVVGEQRRDLLRARSRHEGWLGERPLDRGREPEAAEPVDVRRTEDRVLEVRGTNRFLGEPLRPEVRMRGPGSAFGIETRMNRRTSSSRAARSAVRTEPWLPRNSSSASGWSGPPTRWTSVWHRGRISARASFVVDRSDGDLRAEGAQPFRRLGAADGRADLVACEERLDHRPPDHARGSGHHHGHAIKATGRPPPPASQGWAP